MKKITKKDALIKIKIKCKELKELGADVEFIKFLDEEGWKGGRTKLVYREKNIEHTNIVSRFISPQYTRKMSSPRVSNKRTDEEKAIKIIETRCKEISTTENVISFLGWAEEYKGVNTKLILESPIYGTWNTTTFKAFIYQNVSKPNRINKEIAEKRVLEICNEISTDNEKIVFRGFLGDFKGYSTRLILYNSKYDIEWDTFQYSSFISSKNKILKNIPEDIAKDKINQKCKELSTEGEIITFLGFAEDWKGVYTKLILHNSKFSYTWNWTTYNGLIKKSVKTPGNIVSGDGIYFSRGEIKIEEYFNSRKIIFTPQLAIDSFLIPNCPNQFKVYIDFSLEYKGRKIWIEFNGKQHYHYNSYLQKSYSDFERQQLRDQSLREYAKSNGIEFLEIPYTDLFRIPEIIDSFLETGIDITTKI